MAPEMIEAIDYSAFPVLYVDDESENLKIFELAFRRDFSILRAESGSEALSILATQPVAVVLSDHRMPGMTGTELLARVREIAPKTVRLLVTAYGDASTLANAINQGCIYRYVPKPWDVAEMRAIVRQAIELFALEDQRLRLVTELRALHEASRGIARHLSVDPVVNVTLQTVVSEFGFDGASVLLCSENARTLRMRCSYPALDDEDVHKIALDLDTEPGSVLEPFARGESVLLDVGRALDSRRDVRAFAAALGADDLLLVPLQGRGGIVGCLVVDNRRGGRRFGSGEIQLLQSLGAQAAIAVDNAQLVGELRNEAARTGVADGLACSGALSAAIARELQRPLEQLEAACASSASRHAIGAIARRTQVFAEILQDQAPMQCDVREQLERARVAVETLISECGVDLRIEEGSYPKLDCLPGRLLQLLVHMLELAVEVGASGAVVVSSSEEQPDTVAEVKISCPVEDDLIPDETVHGLRVAACEGLARELGLALEICLEKGSTRWRIATRPE